MPKPRLSNIFASFFFIGCLHAQSEPVQVELHPIEKNFHFGTCTHFDQGWDRKIILPMVDASGLGWVRDEIYWDKIEKTKGEYLIPSYTLDWIKAVHHYGLKLLLIVNGSNSLYNNPYDPDAFAAFAAAMSLELKNDVDAFEILNEPSNFGFTRYYGGTWNGWEQDKTVSPWVSRYVELFNESADEIKKVNPIIKVIGLGSAAPVNFRQIALGLCSSIDGITDHPYSFKTLPERVPYANTPELLARDGLVTADEQGNLASQVKLYREQLEKYRGPRELWFTEFGYGAFSPKTKTAFDALTRKGQAKYLLRRFLECLALDIEVSFQYDFKDDGSDTLVNDNNFGLLDYYLKPKPAFFAVKRLATATANYEPCSQLEITANNRIINSKDSLRAYGFTDPSGKCIVACWRAVANAENDNPHKFNISVNTRFKVNRCELLDLMTGKKTKVEYAGTGKGIRLANFTLRDYPVLLYLD